MKLLLTSDWQAHPRNLHLCEELVNYILDLLAQDKRITGVVHLGDLKDAWNPVDQRVTNFLVEATRKIRDRDCQFLVLLGNHDPMGTDDSLPSILPVLEAAGAVTFSKPGICRAGIRRLAFIPFMRDQDAQRKAFQEIPKADYLFFHCELRGALFDSQRMSASSIEPREAGKQQCFGGHVHFPQSLRSNIHYVGSPFPIDWGEVNQQKRLILLDLRTAKFKSIPLDLESFHDPTVAGFRSKRWTVRDTIRIHVPYKEHGNLPELCRVARQKAEKKYPGAKLHLVPAKETDEAEVKIDIRHKSDKVLIEEYLAQQKERDRKKMVAYIIRQLGQQAVHTLVPIEFQSITAQNVLSFKEAGFKYEPGLTLVTGENHDWGRRSNGTGKSNLLALPAIALLGANPKGQSYDSWRREGSDEKAEVNLAFKIHEDGLLLQRSRNPAQLRLRLNGKNVLSGDIRKSQADLEELVGLTPDVLLNSLYVDQEDVNKLLSGTEKERKQLLSQFLAIGRFEEAEKLTRKDLNEAQKEHLDVETRRGAIADRIASERELLSAIGKARSLEEIDKARNKHRKEIQVCRRKMQAVEAAMSIGTADLAALNKGRNDIGKRTSELRQEAYALDKELSTLAALKETCPTCHQPVSPAILKPYRQQLAERRKALEVELERICKIEQTMARNQQREVQQARERDQLRNDLLIHTSNLQAEEEVLDMEQRLAEMRLHHEKEITKLEKSARKNNHLAQQISKKIDFLRRALAAVGRDGLPAFLIASTCPQLNEAARYYSDLFAEGEIRVAFAITDDRSLDVQVVNVSGSQSLNGQSRGELRMASLITSFAVRDVLTRFNLLILDEPADGLDDVNAQMFAAKLPQVVERFGSVLVTTHNAHIIAGLQPDRHFHVEKKDGVSLVRTQ